MRSAPRVNANRLTDFKPQLSVVIPTQNRDSLPLVLDSLVRQSTRDFEVRLCVDGPFIAPVEKLAVAYAQKGLFVAVHQVCDDLTRFLGAATARNVGLRAARGERVLFIDDDCVCLPELVATHLVYRDTPRAVIGLRRRIAREFWEKEWSTVNLDRLDLVPHRKEVRDSGSTIQRIKEHCLLPNGVRASQWFWTCHASVPVAEARDIGGFWEQMGGSGHEDKEFALRLSRRGVRFSFMVEPYVLHLDHPMDGKQIGAVAVNKERYVQTLRNPHVKLRGAKMRHP
jgi:glycosyltransferase involved in cell wall biosynthesis